MTREELDYQGIKRNWPQYEVMEVLGHGAYGQVYKIRREYFNSVMFSAVKVIHIPPNADMEHSLLSEGLTRTGIQEYYDELVQDFMRENDVMEQLKGAANIMTIEDCVVEKDSEGLGYTIYIKMELLESFENLMIHYQLGPEDIATVGRDICDALIVCEQKHIVHRDIKPANVFINEYGTFKLGDFGVARQTEHTRTNMTQIGTSMYMAPELYSGQMADNRVDIYSLGIMLYRLGNEGCFPFTDPTTTKPSARQDALIRRLSGTPLPLPSRVDKELGQIILKACAYNPNDRYSSARDLKRDLERWKYRQEFPDEHKEDAERESKAREQELCESKARERELKEQLRQYELEEKRRKEAERASEREAIRQKSIQEAMLNEAQKKQEDTKSQTASNMSVANVQTAANSANTVKKKSKSSLIAGITVLGLAAAVVAIAINSGSLGSKSKPPVQLDNVTVGDTITLGSYEQDNNTSNGKEDIEWRVLEEKDDKLLIISKYALDCQQYNKEWESTTWVDCTLRSWLNDDFYNEAFGTEEKSIIVESKITTKDNPDYGTEGGKDTKDYIFLLSIGAAKEHFSSDDDMKCEPTEYAKAQGVYDENGMCWWWLRSPGYDTGSAAGVGRYGGVFTNGYLVDSDDCGVRPALWINR